MKLGLGLLEQRLSAFQVTVGESHPAQPLRRARKGIASAEPTRHGATLLQPGACLSVVALNPPHAPKRLERPANARLVIQPAVGGQSLLGQVQRRCEVAGAGASKREGGERMSDAWIVAELAKLI